MSTCKNIAIFYVYAVVRTSIIFEIWRWLIYGKTSVFDVEYDKTKT